MLKVLIACEESQTIANQFRDLGHEAYSCDLLECSGGHPEYHIRQDVTPLLQKGPYRFKTMDGKDHYVDKWDIIMAHPECTYLTVTGNRWFNVERYGEKAEERIKLRQKAADFFMMCADADCDHIAVENPIGYMSTYWRKPDQIIQPYMFGDPFEKKTCLWLKDLPKLQPTNVVAPPARVQFDSGKTMPAWYANAWHLPKEERSKLRSKTFPGIARAIAEQWSEYVEKLVKENKL